MVDRQQRSSAEKSHRNHLGSHFEHAFLLLIRLFGRFERPTKTQVGRTRWCSAVSYGSKGRKIGSEGVMDGRFRGGAQFFYLRLTGGPDEPRTASSFG